MMELRLAEHSVTPGIVIVEIWDGNTLRGAIYPTDEGIKIHSKYFSEILDRLQSVGKLQQDEITFLVALK